MNLGIVITMLAVEIKNLPFSKSTDMLTPGIWEISTRISVNIGLDQICGEDVIKKVFLWAFNKFMAVVRLGSKQYAL